jgi:hypothetical protein
MRRILVTILAFTLLLPETLLSQEQVVQPSRSSAPASSTALKSSQTGTDTQQPRTVYRPSQAQRRSYTRETHNRHHSSVSKKEVAFMAAIAGTSMGIGALAGGAKGLAIGAIVGGWGAYAGHRLWKWLR